MSKENFKAFVSKNPSFARNVLDGKTTWQKLYELYDLYGENSELWNDFRTSPSNSKNSLNIKGIIDSIKGINMETFQENISSLQKAISFFEDLTRETKKKEKPKKAKSFIDPLDRFYSD